MEFIKAKRFADDVVKAKIMGPNPLKICEELLEGVEFGEDDVVCDLGSGTGITSCLLSREYGLQVYAVDLWSDPEENRAFFNKMGVAEILEMRELACTAEAWADWLSCENDYAVGDRASIEAGALDYLNTIGIVLQKKN